MNYYNQFKAWKLNTITRLAQSYADTIIIKLGESKSQSEFNRWMNQGITIDSIMIDKYDVYLD